MLNLILAFDVVNRTLIASNGSTTDLTSMRRGLYATRIYLRQSGSDFNAINGANYTAFTITGFDGIRAGVWPTSAGTDANLLTLTDQTGWTYNTDDADNPYWSGTLNFATTQIATWIGTDATKGAYFAVNLVKGADLYPVYDQTGATNITILQATDPGSGSGTDMTGVLPKLQCPFQVVKGGLVYVVDINGSGLLEATAI